MTRINVVPVDELEKTHAFGEYKEILRPLNKVRRAIAKYKNQWAFFGHYKKKIPNDYVLGTGHETFFFDKLLYIINRYEQLCEWRRRHDYVVNQIPREELLDGLPEWLLYDYVPTDNALMLNRMRMEERLTETKEKEDAAA